MTDTITLPRSVVEQALEAFSVATTPLARDRQKVLLAIEALHAALDQPQDHTEQNLNMVPAGWKLVPVDPTTKMIDAARSQSSFPAGVWRAMLAAAPKPPVVEQEPVAYYVMNGSALFQLFRSKSQADALAYDLQKRHDLSGSPAHFHVVPLYIRPQPPVVEQPQGEQEPVAWIERWYGSGPERGWWIVCGRDHIAHLGPAEMSGEAASKIVSAHNTSPPAQREPLTDAQINDHRLALPYDGEDLPDPWDFKQGVRAAERVHRIGDDA